MIQEQTKVRVADNTGAKMAKVMKVLGATRARYARVGDVCVVVIKDALPRGTVKLHTVNHAVVVRTAKEFSREDGSRVRFDDNAVVIVSKEGEPKGTRIFGPVARELRERGFQKIISQAPEVV
jgi:large subunit ribosomal protein L14